MPRGHQWVWRFRARSASSRPRQPGLTPVRPAINPRPRRSAAGSVTQRAWGWIGLAAPAARPCQSAIPEPPKPLKIGIALQDPRRPDRQAAPVGAAPPGPEWCRLSLDRDRRRCYAGGRGAMRGSTGATIRGGRHRARVKRRPVRQLHPPASTVAVIRVLPCRGRIPMVRGLRYRWPTAPDAKPDGERQTSASRHSARPTALPIAAARPIATALVPHSRPGPA